jgi:D-3-phosphoglycerate dehydrogenase
MTNHRVLITCPPMLAMRDVVTEELASFGIDAYCPEVIQTLSEDELVALTPKFDGWIIGDDPATAKVFKAACAGKLRAAVKWGVGVDNVDFETARDLDVKITNTPAMFGREVADIAMGYIIATARYTFQIDRAVRSGNWLKVRGNSLAEKRIAVVGFGDIGRNIVKRTVASEMRPLVYDPFVDATEVAAAGGQLMTWPDGIESCDFIVFACALTESTRHMLDASVLGSCKIGVRIINVSRGPLIDEAALAKELETGRIAAAALDVFEQEPLPKNSVLRRYDNCVFGSHNASNTLEAVSATNERAIALIVEMLGAQRQ